MKYELLNFHIQNVTLVDSSTQTNLNVIQMLREEFERNVYMYKYIFPVFSLIARVINK